MPEWLALCDLGVFGWGDLVSAQCCVAFSHISCMAILFVMFRSFLCFVSRHTNPFYNTKSLSFATVLYGPMSLCNVFRRFGCCFVCFCVLFLLFCLFCLFGRVLCFILHRDGLLDCVLVLLQHFFCGPSLKKMD